MAQTSAAPTEVERFAHYRELATQFRGWAKTETNAERRASLLDMAGQYDDMAAEIAARLDAILATRDKRLHSN